MEIDARGLSCPQPIIETRKAIFDKVTSFSVLVDNIAAIGRASCRERV